MATAKLEKNNKTWGIRAVYVDIYGQKQRKYKGGFASKKQAEKWCLLYIEEKVNNPTINSIYSLNKLVEYFLKIKKDLVVTDGLAEVTYADYQYYLEIVKKYFGDIPLETITTPMLQLFINSHLKTPTLCKHIISSLSAMFNIATRHRIINYNPVINLEKPQLKKKEIKCYDANSLNRFLDILKNNCPKYYAYAILLAVAGLRPNEATILKKTNIVKFDDDYFISVVESYSRVKNHITGEITETIKCPKTASGKRLVPITVAIYNELLYFQITNNITSDYVACDENGNRIKLELFTQTKKVLEKKYNLPHITAYGLRHTFGNLNKNAGNDSYTVSKLMGHSDPSVTERNYYHNDIALNKQAINKVTNMIKVPFVSQ